MLCIGATLGGFMSVMNATHMFNRYAERAKAATCPVCRTVNMLGMMCAAAVDNGGFLAFVGEGYGGDWPDPRDAEDLRPGGPKAASRTRR